MAELLANHSQTSIKHLFAHPFRIFFLLVAVYAIFTVLGWIAFLFGGWSLPVGWAPIQWHSHEMVYGFVVAAIAGFVLTAMTNWTGAKPLNNGGLLALVMVWIAGRVAMWLAGWLPLYLVAVVDLAFLPILALYVFKTLWMHQNKRNLVLVFVLSLLFLGNLVMHIGFVTGGTGWLARGQMMGLNLICVLIAIIGGRIIPAFSQNWLSSNCSAVIITRYAPIEMATFASLAVLFIADVAGLGKTWIAGFALLAALANGVRLISWQGWHTRREPLLWILHVAYLWLVVAFILRACSIFTDQFGDTVWLHALGVGAIGTIILGVITRVAVGHTGRPLKLLFGGIGIYGFITAAALLRVVVGFGLLDFRMGIMLSALAWVMAFGMFIVLYFPVLASPRADGKPG